jgi:P4 family phage/plasmid primase-like protien
LSTNNPKEYYSLITHVDIGDVARELIGDRITDESGGVIYIDCPRHTSISHRSFTVDTKKQKWRCWGCDVGGDVLHLVEFIQSGIVTKNATGKMPDSHRAARDYLANKTGLPPLSQWNLSSEQIGEIEKRRSEEELVFGILTDIAAFYHEKLLSNADAKQAFRSQYGISDETIKSLQIGYADNDGLLKHLKEKKYKPRDIAKTGCFNFDFHENMHPVFKNRYVFPYWKHGRAVYLIGRRSPWSEDSDFENHKYKKLQLPNDQRKYISQCVNNRYFFNEDALLTQSEYVVITEGVTDCISLMERGFTAFSPVTNNFSENDLDKLYNLTRRFGRIYICQDNEPSGAGFKGAMKTAHYLESRGLKIYVLNLPLGDKQLQARARLAEIQPETPKKTIDDLKRDSKIDVNEYFLSHSSDDFRELFKTARTPLQFAIEAIPCDVPEDDRAERLQPVLKRISRLSQIDQERYVSLICDRFTSPKIGKTALKATIREIRKSASVGGDDGPTLKDVAADIISFAGPILHASDIGWFLYREGVWKSAKVDEMHNIILERLDSHFKDNNTTKNTRDEIRHRIEVTTGVLLPMESVLNSFGNLLNVTNGMYDIKTGKLLPHDTKYYSTIRLPYPHDPHAKCSRWLQFVNEIFPDDPVSQRVLQEWFGYCLTPDTRHEKALFCLGEGVNGKTKALNVLEHLVGPKNCSHVPLDKLDMDFHTVTLFNKLLNLCIETEARELANTAAFKSIVSGETQEDAYKYRDRFSFPVFARLCYATNHLPRFSDTSRGLYRRILALDFGQDFSLCKDKDLEEKLLAELPGIFQWALEGYRRLRERDEFETPPAMQNIIQDIRRSSSSVAAFVEDECTVLDGSDSGQYVPNPALYDAYKRYCSENGKKPFSSDVFFKELRRAVSPKCEFKLQRIDGKVTRICTNIMLA